MIRLLLLLTLYTMTKGAKEGIPCPLVWVSSSTGSPLPKDVISTTVTGTQHFIARFIPIDSSNPIPDPTECEFAGTETEIYGGRLYNDIAYAAVNSKTEQSNSYEVLTNPHGCVVTWKRYGSINSNFAVSFGGATDHEAYVGRIYLNNAALSGSVSLSNWELSVVDENLNPKKFSWYDFEILESYSLGLKMRLTRVQFEKDIFKGGKDFLGLDEVKNLGDTIVKQTVTHYKKVYEYTRFFSKSTWKHVAGLDLSLQTEFDYSGEEGDISLSGPSLDFSYDLTNDNTESQEKVTETLTEVTVTREVQIAGFTSVQICSTITIARDFDMPFVARAEYSAPGLTGPDILNILAQDGITDAVIEGDICVKEEEGRLQGTLAILTQFNVIPSGGSEGCASLSKKIDHLRRLNADKNATEEERQQVFRDIEKTIANFQNYAKKN